MAHRKQSDGLPIDRRLYDFAISSTVNRPPASAAQSILRA
jgi:hypothetical protein